MAGAHLSRQPPLHGEQRLKRKPWTRKEALGHLVDLAATHHQWFARALTEPNLAISGSPQESWVCALRYRNYPWQDLVNLWISINRLLIHMLAVIPGEKLTVPCRIGIGKPVPLSKLIDRYFEQFQDMIGQLLARL